MASSNTNSKYLKLLYAKGKAPSQKRSMSYYGYLSNYQMVQRGIGLDAWDALKESSIGVIPKFSELDFIWNGKIVHHLLTHQLQVTKNYEIWSLIDWQPIRLSLIEFGFFTGLNCELLQDEDIYDVDHTDFWQELQICTLVGPSLNELRLVLDRCKNWTFEKRRMVGWLCILHIGIYGMAPTSRIPLEVAKRVLDLEAFERYPWGRVACKSLLQSIKNRTSYNVKESYTMEGFVYVLLIWAYESIIGIGEQYGNKIIGEEVPLLSWRGSRKRFEMVDFIIQEKKAHEDKVRVSHFLSYLDGNIVPKGVNIVVYEEVDNLVHDIQNDCVNRQAWDVITAPSCKRGKRKEIAPLSDSENPTTKKINDIHGFRDSRLVNSSSGDGNKMVDGADLAMLQNLSEKVDNMDTNLSAKLSGFDAVIGTKVNAILTPFTEKLATLEKEMEKLLGKKVLEIPIEVSSKEATNSNTNEEVTSKAMSWMVQMKSTSQDDLPICVAKTVKNACKTKIGDKKVIKTEIQVPQLRDTSSMETLSEPIHCDIFKGASGRLDEIAAKVNKLIKPSPPEPLTPPHKRKTKLAPSQIFPFVGNSTVKCIITGVTPSVTAYDPFVDVDTSKIQLNIEKKPDRTNYSSVEFYKVIMTPRAEWPNQNYGWLNNWHMWCAMRMFHQRSLRDPSPFHSQRIVFLDQLFVRTLVNDFKAFNAKTWTAPNNI